MTLRINIKLLETDGQIKKAILDSIKDVLDTAISKSLNRIQQDLKALTIDNLKKEPEYASLRTGQLRYEFGIPDTIIVDRVIEDICEGKILRNPVKVGTKGISGNIKYILIDEDKVNASMGGPDGIVQDAKGYTLPWLKWLLTQGTAPIVKNFEVKLGPNPNSRTGMAIMVESNENWGVPPQFAGVKDNNWITRAISSINEDLFFQIIQKNIEQNI